MTVFEQDLRAAVASGAYGQAQDALRAYAEALEASLQGMLPESRRGVLEHARGTLEWAKRVVGAGRAHAAAEMDRVLTARAYRADPREAPRTWLG
jgi:hypothetical protein